MKAMKLISVLGRKGGSGKTHVSHQLCFGFGALDFPTLMYQSDVRSTRPPEALTNRPYIMKCVTGGEASQDVAEFQEVAKLAHRFDSVLVVDGGANRRAMDFVFAGGSDMILIPMGYGSEDVEVALADFDEIVEHTRSVGRNVPTFIILNRWPGDKRKQDMVLSKPWVEHFMSKHGDKRFPIMMPDTASSQDLAFHDGPVTATLQVQKRAKDLASFVAQGLGITPPARVPQEYVEAA